MAHQCFALETLAFLTLDSHYVNENIIIAACQFLPPVCCLWLNVCDLKMNSIFHQSNPTSFIFRTANIFSNSEDISRVNNVESNQTPLNVMLYLTLDGEYTLKNYVYSNPRHRTYRKCEYSILPWTRDGKFTAVYGYGQRDEGLTPLPGILPMTPCSHVFTVHEESQENFFINSFRFCHCISDHFGRKEQKGR